MSKIRIKNFGPIKEGYIENDGWIEVKKVTVFIGSQGSGKSTVAKVISTLMWLEKAMNRGDVDKGKLSFFMLKRFFNYHKIDNYFLKNTYIEYYGEKYHILCDRTKEYPIVSEVKNKTYIVPKIMYIPSERNFLSTISDAFDVKGLPDNLFTFAEELRKVQKELNGEKIKLPIEGYFYEYDENENLSYVVGTNYKISLLEASSGLQSFIPLYLVSKSLSSSIAKKQKKESLTVTQAVRLANEIMEIMEDKTLAENEKSKKATLVKVKYFNKCFQNIVEEPEQNLFPSSQWEMLKSLLEFNNKSKGSRLIMTTHSPYLINYLSIAIQGNYLNRKIKKEELKKRLNNVVPLKSTVKSNDVAIYQLDENTGTITKLPDYEGIPSDKNYLNQSLAEGNRLFDSLLEIEQEL